MVSASVLIYAFQVTADSRARPRRNLVVHRQGRQADYTDRLIGDIINRFDLLADQLGMGRACLEFGPGVRSFAENYVVYYRLEGNES